jgi:dihydroorotate dehydrogenase
MLYSSLVRPLLFRMEPEQAHDLTLKGCAVLSRLPVLCRFVREMARPRPWPVTTMGLNFPNPVGLAGGMDKNAVAPYAWWAMGFGFLELGTVTPLPQPGNDKPRMFRVPGESALINRMGFNNQGAEAVAARLKLQAERGQRPAFPIGMSLGKNKLTADEQTAEDYARGAKVVAALVDFLSINVSSPNTPGLRQLQTPAWLSKLVGAVRAESLGKPVLVKVAPELDGDALRSSAEAVMGAGAAGLIATNTLGTMAPTGEPAGKSGQPLKEIAPRRIETLRSIVGSSATLIGVGGIDDAASARRMLDAGADLVQIYTGLVYQGPWLPVTMTRGLHKRNTG